MFERSKVDNSRQVAGVIVEMSRDDGSLEKGKLLIAVASKVADALNGTQEFLEFESFEGRRRLVAKTSIREISVVEGPGAAVLDGRNRDAEFDPYRVLGLEPGCGWEAIRNAYHERAKTYHPDRYANAQLPAEVTTYLATMARRINAAFALLEEPMQMKRQAAKLRTDPVYASPGR